jgi:DNA repair exonuclease SbcCD ATPase subunit
MTETHIEHGEHKGLWIRITETANSFKVENCSTDEKQTANYKSKLLLKGPIYFFKGRASDRDGDLRESNLKMDKLSEHSRALNKWEAELKDREQAVEDCAKELDQRERDLNAEHCDQNIREQELKQKMSKVCEESNTMARMIIDLRAREERVIEREADLHHREVEWAKTHPISDLRVRDFERREKELDEHKKSLIAAEKDIDSRIQYWGEQTDKLDQRERELKEQEERTLTDSYNRGLVDGRKDQKKECEDHDRMLERVSISMNKSPEDLFMFRLENGDQLTLRRKYLFAIEGPCP